MSNKNLNKDEAQTTVLVTGGAGFIGSHTCVELINSGYKVVVIDNLSNSSQVALDRVKEITNVEDDRLVFYENDLLDKQKLKQIFSENNIDAIIHFAGFKAVGESVAKPLEYYVNNMQSTFVLCECAKEAGVKNLIFSSSSTVYGETKIIPITEHNPKENATNPYGQTKTMQEQILRDLFIGDNE